MADNASFKRGAKVFPLPTGTGRSALQDADPFTFFALDFISKVIETHIGPRLMEAASQSKAIKRPVAMKVPYDPVPVLGSTHLAFPLLAVYREGGRFDRIAVGRRRDVSVFELVYVLPPLDAALIEQLVPILVAARDAIDDRVEEGMDPTYAPPGGELGDVLWVNYAGAVSVGLTEYEIGPFEGTAKDVLFYALRMRGEVSERTDLAPTQYEQLNGVTAAIAVSVTTEPDFDVSTVSTYPDPTLTSASPNTGSIAGDTLVTLAGTGFRPGTTPVVRFGPAAATDVVVIDAETVQCRTPAHGGTIVHVTLTPHDGGEPARLVAGFTFTTP